MSKKNMYSDKNRPFKSYKIETGDMKKRCLKTIWLYTFTHSYTMSAGMRWLLFAFFLTLYFSESSNIVTKIGLGNNLDRQQLDKG